MLNVRQTSEVETLKKHVITDDRTQCPICILDVADLSGRTGLTKHLASHLERFSLDCLPLSTSSWGNENLRDNESESSDPDQGLASEPHEQTVLNEQDDTTENFKAQQGLEEGYLSVENREQSEAITQETNLERETIDTEKEGASPIYRRTVCETEEGLWVDGLHLVGRVASYSTEFKHENTRSLTELAEAATQDKTTRGTQLELEKISTERQQILEEFDRKQRKAKEEAGEEEQSISMNLRLEKIYTQMRWIVADQERIERKLKDQKDRAAAELPKSRTERLESEVNDMRTEQDNMNDAMRKRLEEADFTPSQIDAIMSSGNGREQQPASSTLKAAPPPAAGEPTNPRAPVYPKVHTDYMATETLRYYDIPWEYDKVRKTGSL